MWGHAPLLPPDFCQVYIFNFISFFVVVARSGFKIVGPSPHQQLRVTSVSEQGHEGLTYSSPTGWFAQVLHCIPEGR